MIILLKLIKKVILFKWKKEKEIQLPKICLLLNIKKELLNQKREKEVLKEKKSDLI